MAFVPKELELATALLECLRSKLAENPNPPAQVCLRIGQEVVQGLSSLEDECCDGLAYVKVNQVYPSINFPEQSESPYSCGIDSWAVDLEMGVFRCAPVGDEQHLPGCDEWTTTATQVAYDAAAMRAAVSCFRSLLETGDSALVRAWTPLPAEGGCGGGTQVVTVGFFDQC